MPTASTPSSSAAEDYGVLMDATIHLDDLDSMGLLRNGHYSVLAERAWIGYWMGQDMVFLDGATPTGDAFCVVKELRVSYEYPVRQPGPLGVRLWIEHQGRTSVTHGFQVLSADGAVSHARGTRTLVRLDPETFRPAEWSDHSRSLARQLMRPAASPS
jgi:acyl-CoA thioester hydrolase